MIIRISIRELPDKTYFDTYYIIDPYSEKHNTKGKFYRLYEITKNEKLPQWEELDDNIKKMLHQTMHHYRGIFPEPTAHVLETFPITYFIKHISDTRRLDGQVCVVESIPSDAKYIIDATSDEFNVIYDKVMEEDKQWYIRKEARDKDERIERQKGSSYHGVRFDHNIYNGCIYWLLQLAIIVGFVVLLTTTCLSLI